MKIKAILISAILIVGVFRPVFAQTTVTTLGATDRVDRAVLNANFNNLKASVDGYHPSTTNHASHNIDLWSNSVVTVSNVMGIGSGIISNFVWGGYFTTNPPTAGQIAKYNATAGRWYAAAEAAAGSGGDVYQASNSIFSATNSFTTNQYFRDVYMYGTNIAPWVFNGITNGGNASLSITVPDATSSNQPVTFAQLQEYAQESSAFFFTTNKTTYFQSWGLTPTNATYKLAQTASIVTGSINVPDTGATGDYFFAEVFTNFTITALNGGVAKIELWASESSAGTMLVKPEGYIIDSVNSNIIEAADFGEVIEISGTTPAKYSGTIPYNSFQTNNPCYMAIKLKAGSTANKNVTIYTGNGTASHFELPLPVSALTTDLLKLDGSRKMTGALGMGANLITNLANGTLSNHAVNLGQLQSATNAAVIDATNRVAQVGYLQPASTNDMARLSAKNTFTGTTNTFSGAVNVTGNVGASGYVAIGTTNAPVADIDIRSATAKIKIIDPGNDISSIDMGSYDMVRGRIRCEGNNPGYGSGTGSGILRFYTAQNPTLTECMTLGVGGEVYMPLVVADGITSAIDVHMSASGQLGYDTSSIRFKENVLDTAKSDYDKLMSIKPKKYDRKDGAVIGEYGFIAEEVAALDLDIPNLLIYNRIPQFATNMVEDVVRGETIEVEVVTEQGETNIVQQYQGDITNMVEDIVFTGHLVDTNDVMGVNYSRIIPLLLDGLRRQQAQIDALTARVARLEGK